MTTTHQVDFQPIGKRVEVAAGASLLEAAQQAGLQLASACGGMGSCGQCRVIVLAGEVSPPDSDETFILTEAERHSGHRLACRARLYSDVKLRVPKESVVIGQRLQLSGETHGLSLDPLVHSHRIEVPPPSLQDPRADLERVTAALAEQHELSSLTAEPAVIRQLSGLARQQDWRLAAYIRGDEIIGLAPPDASPLGLAVDLGTTKIAASLVDLGSGEELAVAGALNPQIGYGEDVVSRLAHVRRREEGGQNLARLVRETLDELLGQLVEQAGVSRSQVVDGCIVGNTAMTHLLLELPVAQLAMSPYVAATNAPVDIKACSLGLAAAPGASIHLLPGIGGYVGGDHVAMILASQLDRPDRVTLGVDIGTNTEIVLAKPGRDFLTSASCASGPAFEGAHIADGMRAASGAIEAIRLTETGLELTTIDDAPAIGLCGSGIVDAVAALLRWEIINERGRFDKEHQRVRAGQGGPELVLTPAAESGSGRDVVIGQSDVNEIQLAKGAIRAGIEILLDASDTAPEAVEEVIVAGAFGSFLNLQSALAIGLFPPLPQAGYRQVGNAALVGARWALLSSQARERTGQIAARTGYLELTNYPRFNRRFAQGMLFD